MKSCKKLEYISSVSYESSTYYTEMKKQRAGFLIKEILDRFTNKTMSLLKPDRSLWIYAIHSTGMVNILNSLGVFDVSFHHNVIFFQIQAINTIRNFFSEPFPVSHSTVFFEHSFRATQTQ